MMIEFAVGSDLFSLGRNEDGEERHAEFYYVMAEHDNGRRWIHPDRFPSAVRAISEEDGESYWKNVTETAKAEAELECAKARAAHFLGKLDPERDWHSTASRYGSSTHCEADHYDAEERHRFLRY
jgi:hypothetical protein